MKLKKLRKLLGAGAVLLAFFITECRGGRDASNQIDITAGPSTGRKRRASEIELVDAVLSPASQEMPKEKKQKKSDDSSSETSDTDCQEEGSGDRTKNEKQRKKRIKIEIKDLDVDLWNNKRLDNTRRKSYKLNCNIVSEINNLNISMNYVKRLTKYQEKLRKDIKEFCTHVAQKVEDNVFLYFIACRSTTINKKYKDFFGIKELIEDDNNMSMLTNFQGYYPGILDDMIAYIEKHRQMRTVKDSPLTEWKERIGDIFIRNCLDLKRFMPREQKMISELEKKYQALACAVQMIFMLPEVYQDFSKISEVFIKSTHITDTVLRNNQNHQVLLAVKRLLKIKIEKREHAGMYKELYAVFAGIYGEKELLKSKEVDLYRRIYIALGKFYKKVQVADENEYILIGKNIIVNQKYVKCEKTVNLDIAQEISNESVASPEYMLKMNKWGVSLNVHQHYHVHYVDNTATRSRMLCMPIHEDSEGNKLYLHTIDGIVEHIKILYGIYKDSDSVHPFRVEKGTKLWSYIKKKDRHLTMKDLSEYNIVFYHIEEDFDKAEFTFAEFWPKTPWGDGVICIPLFLTPLMRSAVALGPFVQKKDHKVVDLEEFEDKKPSVYMYNKKYNENNYSDVHKYYRNLYIRQEKEKENIDCYTMDCRTAKEENRAIKAVWYVRMPDSVDEYTHCIPDESFKGKENTEKFNNFVNALESREYNKDSDLQGIWLSNNSNGEDIEQEKKTKSICNWLVEINNKKKKTTKSQEQIKSQISVYEQRLKMKQEEVEEIKKSNKNKHRNQADYTKVKKTTITMISKYRKNLEILYKELSSQPSTQAELIVFRNMNSSKSNLGAHNEMFDVLISRYKYRTQAEVNWQ